MKVGHAFKQRPPEGAFDAIVIGSGLGGLITAATLAQFADKRVLVLEKHYRIGGYTHVFSRPGFEWDVGVHYVGSLGERTTLRNIFETLSEARLKWAQLPDVYDAIELGDRRYEFVSGARRFIDQLAARFPDERDALEKYLKLITATARRGQFGFMNRIAPSGPPKEPGEPVTRAPRDYRFRTTHDVISSLTTNEELLAVLTGQYGDYGLPPRRSSFGMHASVVEHYLEGAWYPVGGSAELARALAPTIERKGGHLAHSAEVVSIVIEGGAAVGVELKGGVTLRAPIVISGAGVPNTFGKLVPEASRPERYTTALKTLGPSSPYLCLYVGLTGTDEALGLNGTNLWVYPDGHHDENTARFGADPEAPFPMLYFSFPSAKDPDFQRRFPGRATLEVITMAQWEWFSAWEGSAWQKRGAAYDALKQRFRARLLEAVLKRLPQLEGKIAHAELSTPLSTAHFSGHAHGEIYGLDSSPARFDLPLHAQTPVPGLYLTGADLGSPGVGGAAFAGVLTASAILGPDVMWSLVKQ